MKKKKTPEELSDTDKFRAMFAKMNPNTNTPYLVAVLISLVIGIGGVVALVSLRPDFDVLVVSGVVFAFLTPTTTSILSLMKSQETNRQARETHLSVNSRLDAFIKSASDAARAEGLQEGRDKANARTDALAGKYTEELE
ncbi:MAG: APC family permease [Chloroflexi bacterium]|nr:MAG: APC family permease [Chloroflexota bacterium]